MKSALKTFLAHSGIWVCYVGFAVLAYGYENDLLGTLHETTISYAVSISILYSHQYFLEHLWEKRKYVAYAGSLLCLFVYNFLIRYNLAFYFFPLLFGDEPSVAGFSLTRLMIIFSFQCFTFIAFSIGYWLLRRQVRMEREAREKDHKEADKEKKLLEYAVLQAQIDPHFLFNTLDSFRIQAEPVFPDMSRSIMALVHVIRAALSKPENDGQIPVIKEISVIDSLISIYLRRFPNMCYSYQKSVPEQCNFRMPPHVLLAFVENAFKHGSLNDNNKKLRIELILSNESLHLIVYNKKNKRPNTPSHGIGMHYITKQLENFYKDQYELHIDNRQEEYLVNLKIQKQ